MGSKFPHRDYSSVDVFRRKDIFMLAQKPAAICNNLVGNNPLLGVPGICLFYSLISFTQLIYMSTQLSSQILNIIQQLWRKGSEYKPMLLYKAVDYKLSASIGKLIFPYFLY